MNLIKKLGAMSVALFVSVAAVAESSKPVLDVIVPYSNTGNGWKQGVMIQKALEAAGWDSEMVHTGSCPGTNDYAGKTDRPGIFLASNSVVAAFAEQGCNLPVSDKTFVGPYFDRSQAMCVAGDSNFTSIEEFVKGKSRITVGNTSSLPAGLYDDLSKQFGVEFVRVDYNGSGSTFRGMLAGEVDMIYQGYTAREVNSELKCFATTLGVNNTAKFDDLFPNWSLSNITEYTALFGIGLESDESKAKAREAVYNALANDPDLSAYYAKSFIVTGDKMQGQDLSTFNEKLKLFQ